MHYDNVTLEKMLLFNTNASYITTLCSNYLLPFLNISDNILNTPSDNRGVKHML